jgi:hypothetical protein
MSTTRHTNGSIPCCADEIRAEPQLPRWPRLVEANPSFYGGRPSRRVDQEELLKKARQYTGGTLGLTCPSPRAGTHVVATGHQPFWHHCGVWVKTLACSRLAQAVHGTAVHVVLDHDVCDTGLTIPQPGANGTWERRRLALEPGRAAGPVELRRPDAASVERFVEELTRAHPDQLCNMLWMQFDAAEAVRSGRLRTMADLVTDLQAVLNAPFGADDVLYLPVSQLSATDAFLDFAVSAMSNAMYFAQCYNDAVARCRPGRHGRLVIPPLALDAARGQTELPFWLVRSEGDRASLHVQLRSAGVLSLGATAGEAGPLDAGSAQGKAEQLRQLLASHRWMLRPKAVTLTLFLRLHLVDWFVHGTGGARYEPITDHLLRDYYGMRPPHYGVVTCTATLPRCSCGPPTREPGSLRHQLHHLRHNPEPCLPAPACQDGPIERLVRAKNRYIACAADPRLPDSGHKTAWECIARINQQLCKHAGRAIADLEAALAQSRQESAARAVCESREYFFGLFPLWRLARIAEAMTFADPDPSCASENRLD